MFSWVKGKGSNYMKISVIVGLARKCINNFGAEHLIAMLCPFNDTCFNNNVLLYDNIT